LSVEVAQHVLLDSWENLDEGLSLDLGAINDPCDDGAESLLIELGFFLKKRGKLIVPVVVVDRLLGCGPLSEEVEHVLVVLVVCGGEVSSVDISLVVVEVKFPLWLCQGLFLNGEVLISKSVRSFAEIETMTICWCWCSVTRCSCSSAEIETRFCSHRVSIVFIQGVLNFLAIDIELEKDLALEVIESRVEHFCAESHSSHNLVSCRGHVEAGVGANLIECIDNTPDVTPWVCLKVESVCSPRNVLPPLFDGSLLLLELLLSVVNALIESVNEAELSGVQCRLWINLEGFHELPKGLGHLSTMS